MKSGCGANLSKYFEAIDKRLEKILPEKTSLLAHINGYTVRMVFPSLEYARYAVPDMFTAPDTGEEVDATFIWWEDSIVTYLLGEPIQVGGDIFLSEDSTGMIEIFGDTLRGEDYLRSRYYLLSSPTTQCKWPIAVHPFAKAIFLWAQRRNMLMLHAASVGVEDKGVLLVGHGGSGKSTLAVSCLLDSFSFVTDDYCLINVQGVREVYPIYTNVSLTPYSLKRMPLFKPFEILPMQGEKQSFWVSEQRIAKKMEIKAIVLPQIGASTEPVIEKDNTSKALGQVVYSTTKQLGRYHDTQYVKNISQRLLGLPVFRFKVSEDLEANSRYFKKWMEENL